MKAILYTAPKLLIADEGKMLRSKNDIPTEENKPYYTSVIFLGDQINSLEECKELYVEEEI
jgi:hypothetical protein